MKNEGKHWDKVWDKNIIDKIITPIPSPESKEVESVPEWVYLKASEYVTEQGFTDDLDKDLITDAFISGYGLITSPIEVIKKRLEELEACRITVDGYPLAMGIISAQISELNHILKLIKE